MLLTIVTTTVLNGVLLDLLPRRSSRRTYFGVTTGREFVTSPEGRHIARDYTVNVWLGTLLSLAFVLVAAKGHTTWMFAFAAPFQAGAAAAAWLRAWTRSNQHTAQRKGIEVEILEDNVRLSFPLKLLVLLPFLKGPSYILIFSVLYGQALQFFGVHGLSAPRLLGFVLILFILLWMFDRPHYRVMLGVPDSDYRESQLSSVAPRWVFLVCLALSILSTALPMNIADMVPGRHLITLGLQVASISSGVWFLITRPKPSPPTVGDGTPDDCWKGGILYFNPQDCSPKAPADSRWAYTPNLSNSKGRTEFCAEFLGVAASLGAVIALRT